MDQPASDDYRFNPPPNWPQVPEGYRPQRGWNPPPSWEPAPEGWQFWVRTDGSDRAPSSGAGSRAAITSGTATANASTASAPSARALALKTPPHGTRRPAFPVKLPGGPSRPAGLSISPRPPAPDSPASGIYLPRTGGVTIRFGSAAPVPAAKVAPESVEPEATVAPEAKVSEAAELEAKVAPEVTAPEASVAPEVTAPDAKAASEASTADAMAAPRTITGETVAWPEAKAASEASPAETVAASEASAAEAVAAEARAAETVVAPQATTAEAKVAPEVAQDAVTAALEAAAPVRPEAGTATTPTDAGTDEASPRAKAWAAFLSARTTAPSGIEASRAVGWPVRNPTGDEAGNGWPGAGRSAQPAGKPEAPATSEFSWIPWEPKGESDPQPRTEAATIFPVAGVVRADPELGPAVSVSLADAPVRPNTWSKTDVVPAGLTPAAKPAAVPMTRREARRIREAKQRRQRVLTGAGVLACAVVGAAGAYVVAHEGGEPPSSAPTRDTAVASSDSPSVAGGADRVPVASSTAVETPAKKAPDTSTTTYRATTAAAYSFTSSSAAPGAGIVATTPAKASTTSGPVASSSKPAVVAQPATTSKPVTTTQPAPSQPVVVVPTTKKPAPTNPAESATGTPTASSTATDPAEATTAPEVTATSTTPETDPGTTATETAAAAAVPTTTPTTTASEAGA